MPNILGVDPALSNTGFTVFDTDTMKLTWQGAIKNPSGSSRLGVTPYNKIRDAVKTVIESHKIDHVFVERMFQSRNPAVTEALFIAQFMVKLACHEMGVPFHVVSIMGKDGWKNFVLGSDYTSVTGNLAKRHTRNATEKALGVRFQSEHVADSACIALAGWYLFSGTDYRTVLGVPIPEGVGIAAGKKPKMGGRKPRESKSRKTSRNNGCDPGDPS
jgi:Holliday junction resolvasome RuvABC endonuclease subunit